MLEMGTRFTNRFYVKTSIDPDNGDCYVEVEIITDEGAVRTITGQVIWDE